MTDYSNASHGGLLGEVDMKGDWEGGRKQKEGIRVSPSCATSLPSSPPPLPPLPICTSQIVF